MHDTLILFGATGDLAQRYLFPSLLHLWRDRMLPTGFRVLGVGRQPFDDEGFRNWLRERHGDSDAHRDLEGLLGRVRYVSLDVTDQAAVKETLAPYADRPSVSYLATPPDLFVPAARGLLAAGVLASPSRLVLEKPIGHDLASAREIDAALAECLEESRIFRIDHYLGKAPVQNLLALRLGNTLMEAVWQHRWIESVDILVAETSGVEGREDYYARYGALRDMVQNHMLQLLALIAMEPPASLASDCIRDEKQKVLRALRPMTQASAATDSVRGSYGSGVVEGDAVPAYEGRPVETFVALQAWIDNWRWSGVPFRLVTGKRLATRSSEVVVSFRPVSHWLFERPRRERARANRLRVRLQPQETIELGLMGSLAAPEWGALELRPMSLDLDQSTDREHRIAYESLLVDALRGDQTLFVRDDEVEAAWRWIDSIESAWTQAGTPLLVYPAGSWGPPTAAQWLPRTLDRPVRAP